MAVDGLASLRTTSGQDEIRLNSLFVFANLPGSDSQALGYRTWDSEPVGWYRLTGPAGLYTVCFTRPAGFARPVLKTNVLTRDHQRPVVSVSARADHAQLSDDDWDKQGASLYIQRFTARGTSVTSVGLRLAHDGVDGEGPGAGELLVAVLDASGDDPTRWKQIGPEVPVRGVDAGGVKNAPFSAGWNSGEVPTKPGGSYAVRIRSAAGAAFQPFWTGSESRGCWRGGSGYSGHDIWLVVSGDSDMLVIPYNKRIHTEYKGETAFAKSWGQTYRAQGEGLAAVCLYTMFSGEQPGIARQRVQVSVREGGPAGPIVGIWKIGIGSGNYTGDASWGAAGAVFAPGEVPVTPGRTYCIQFESLETDESLDGFTNIKGFGNRNPGFHPYPKAQGDGYAAGRAYMNGQPTNYDLDMQIVEYRHNRPDWAGALAPRDRVTNGSLDTGVIATDGDPGLPAGWRWFSVHPQTQIRYTPDPLAPRNRLVRIVGGGYNGKLADGGMVQRVGGLDKAETYSASALVRSTWPLDTEHAVLVGVDASGQTEDPNSPGIQWSAGPLVHSRFVRISCPAVRPAQDAVSIWLRAKTSAADGFGFRADFDDITLRQVESGVPAAR